MVRQVVVVFDGLEGCFFTVETEVVNGYGVGEEGLESGDHGEARAEDGDKGD